MKRNFFRSISFIMCIIIACISCSVGSFAASGKVYTIDELKNCRVDSVITNESETITVLTLNYNTELAVTKNGKDYSIINFDKYLPAGSDYIEMYKTAKNGDLFVVLLRAYKTETFTEEYYDEYDDEFYTYEYEKDVLTAQIILTTTDFVSFEKYNFNASNDEDIITEDREYLCDEYGMFGFVGDTLVFADMSYKYTKQTDSGSSFVGVYYTTKDFKNWTVNYTPEQKMNWHLGPTSIFSYKSTYDKNALLIEFSNDGISLFGAIFNKSYITGDFKNYTTVYNEKSNKSVYESLYCVDEELNYCYRLDLLENDEFKQPSEWIKIDLKTGQETVLLKDDDKYYWRYYYNKYSNTAYYLIEKTDGTVEAYCLNSNTGSLKKMPIDYKLSDGALCSNYGKTLLFYANGKLCVSTSWNPLEYNAYDISSFGFDKDEIYPFVLNGKLYILENTYYSDGDNDEYNTRVAETDISLQKKGDLNGDNKINSTDALLVLRVSVGEMTLTQDQKSVADVNKDGKINSTDALMILQFATGILQSL